MAHLWADRVKQPATTTGTGTWTLGTPVAGFIGFDDIAGAADGDTAFYRAEQGSDWEVGLSTLGGSLTTLARTAVLASSNGGAAVNFTSAPTIVLDFPADKAALPIVTKFTSSNTFTPRPSTRLVCAIVKGGGAPGAAGSRRASGAANNNAGAGGQGGAVQIGWFTRDQIGASQSVTVAAAQPGPAGQTTNDTAGANGTNGNDSSFGSLLTARGGGAGNGNGLGNTTHAVPVNPFVGNPTGGGQSTASSAANGGTPVGSFGGNGGAGGGITSGNATISGGSGTIGYGIRQASTSGAGILDGAGATTDGANGGNGSDAIDALMAMGGGGGGGKSSTSGPGGAGGDGGTPGGGGGGGGSSQNGQPSGDGGDGARGEIITIEF